MNRVLLGAAEAVPEGGSAGFVVELNGERLGILAVRREGRVHAYVNRCPHIGAPLDFTPGQFLDMTRTHILCANHGALFRIDDGLCFRGPCAGRSLTPLRVEEIDGDLYLIA